MNMQRNRQLLALLVTLTLVIAPLVTLGIYIYGEHQKAQALLEKLEPRHARLLGLSSQESDIAALLEQVQKAGEQYVYPASQDAAQAGNAAQQRIREIFSAAGLQISSSQVLPSKTEKGFERIPLTVRADGDLLAVQSALAVLSSQLPLILISDMDVQLVGGLQNVQPSVVPRLAVQFTFGILKGQNEASCPSVVGHPEYRLAMPFGLGVVHARWAIARYALAIARACEGGFASFVARLAWAGAGRHQSVFGNAGAPSVFPHSQTSTTSAAAKSRSARTRQSVCPGQADRPV